MLPPSIVINGLFNACHTFIAAECASKLALKILLGYAPSNVDEPIVTCRFSMLNPLGKRECHNPKLDLLQSISPLHHDNKLPIVRQLLWSCTVQPSASQHSAYIRSNYYGSPSSCCGLRPHNRHRYHKQQHAHHL